ncbi:hypothetical protein NIES2107_68620 (plasmid) [Nostoc carneum NIES-2107]|nr:hypothetical protein NIES2107_68620 [Nostoc carneum NIES-2107]
MLAIKIQEENETNRCNQPLRDLSSVFSALVEYFDFEYFDLENRNIRLKLQSSTTDCSFMKVEKLIPIQIMIVRDG